MKFRSRRRVSTFAPMDAFDSDPDAYRAASPNATSRRYVMLSASNIIQAPLSALLEYSGLLSGRSSHQEVDTLMNGRVTLRFRDHHRGHLEESTSLANEGEVSIKIIGAGEQEHDREATGLVVGQVREAEA